MTSSSACARSSISGSPQTQDTGINSAVREDGTAPSRSRRGPVVRRQRAYPEVRKGGLRLRHGSCKTSTRTSATRRDGPTKDTDLVSAPKSRSGSAPRCREHDEDTHSVDGACIQTSRETVRDCHLLTKPTIT
ncbi:hypothetical protein EXIGLDRAFT_39328 [Exidia glandulosa HHB12029]|uniref:Uncharacterized protein n=1 Tax=Exidia glandulosa HHB12029 TaxID=1314781 RepID=A0A165INC8_EXIGL|nr:hypothetical protein EXIGLDRAFT_39328 [Exidia glandulosa HHB12029]